MARANLLQCGEFFVKRKFDSILRSFLVRAAMGLAFRCKSGLQSGQQVAIRVMQPTACVPRPVTFDLRPAFRLKCASVFGLIASSRVVAARGGVKAERSAKGLAQIGLTKWGLFDSGGCAAKVGTIKGKQKPGGLYVE